MLKKFKVKNFKNFNEVIEIDFSKTDSEYEFNQEVVKNNIINKSAIYGKNASGKSNLGLAIFDIVKNLTDKETHNNLYKNYLSANSEDEYAEFEYLFQIDENLVEYSYKKSDYDTILDEELKIDGKIMIKYNREEKKDPIFNLPEAITLNKNIGQNKISVVKYLRNNTILQPESSLVKFFRFIDNMLFFKSVEGNLYLGYSNGIESIERNLIKNKQIESLEQFLQEAGVECKLSTISIGAEEVIAFDFNGKKYQFMKLPPQEQRIYYYCSIGYKNLKNFLLYI